jgi:hypothetical protein|tara:strand:- start:322 stop:573 length:252 start_codon:yes stop_codon:yes gene_type:complete
MKNEKRLELPIKICRSYDLYENNFDLTSKDWELLEKNKIKLQELFDELINKDNICLFPYHRVDEFLKRFLENETELQKNTEDK